MKLRRRAKILRAITIPELIDAITILELIERSMRERREASE